MSAGFEDRRIPREEDRIPVRTLALALLAGAALSLGCVLGARALSRPASSPIAASPDLPPLPDQVFHGLIAEERPAALQTARAEAVLASYGWVDRERRVVRIPIERAIDLVTSGATASETSASGRQR